MVSVRAWQQKMAVRYLHVAEQRVANNWQPNGLVNRCSQSFDAISLGFKRSQRLLKSADFSAVFNDAPFRASSAHFLILSRLNDSNYPRLGLVIAKKHIRLANQRNHLKRQIRESFRHNQHHLPSIDAIVLARKGADSLSNSEIQHTLNGLWKRVIQKVRQHQSSNTSTDV